MNTTESHTQVPCASSRLWAMLSMFALYFSPIKSFPLHCICSNLSHPLRSYTNLLNVIHELYFGLLKMSVSKLTLRPWDAFLFHLVADQGSMGTSLTAQLGKNLPAVQEAPVQFLGREDLLEKGRLPTPVFLGFPGGSDSKVTACNVGDLGPIPSLGNPLEKEIATHSSTLAWKIPRMEEPGRLQSMESQRVVHD